MKAQPAAVPRRLTCADGANRSLRSSPGPAATSRTRLGSAPSLSLEAAVRRSQRTAAAAPRTREDAAGVGGQSAAFSLESHPVCWELDFIALPETQAEAFGFDSFFLLFFRTFSLQHEAAATSDEPDTAAAAVGAQI